MLAAVLVLNFLLFRMMAEDPVASIIDRISPRGEGCLARMCSLDSPARAVPPLRQVVTFDFGISFLTGRPVLDELRSCPGAVFLRDEPVISSFLGT
ncbi:hypothetical protein MASR2M17_23800 [Aminivibrio sp.]